jgi:HEAT repeat protein
MVGRVLAFGLLLFITGFAIKVCAAETKPVRAAAPDAREAKLTAENYVKIQPGMTAAEVKEILGPPRSTATSGFNHDMTMTWFLSGERGHKLEVHFTNGVVVSKFSNLSVTAPPKPPVEAVKPKEQKRRETPDDPFDAAMADLLSRDVKKHVQAIEYFEKAPFDEARAGEVGRRLVKDMMSKEPRVSMAAENAAPKWATKENADAFLAIIERPQREKNGMEKHLGQIAIALDVLARLKEPAAVPAMVKMLRNFFNRSNAAEALKRMGPELAEKELQKVANDRDANVSTAAREILAEFKDGGPELTRNLKELNAPKWETRIQAVQQIGKMYVHPGRRADVAKALEARLSDENATVVRCAAHALARWGMPESEAAVIKALAHGSAEVRLEAAQALGAFGTLKAIPALEPLEQDKDRRVVVAAREASALIKNRNHP